MDLNILDIDTINLDDLYGNTILEHCRDPRNRHKLRSPDITARAVNPFCGDEVEIQVILNNERISKISAQAIGCSINQATTSLLSETIKNMSLSDIQRHSTLFRQMMTTTLSSDETKRLGKLATIANVRNYPVRIKCALLPWSALDDICNEGKVRP